jgi:hypothetical protein
VAASVVMQPIKSEKLPKSEHVETKAYAAASRARPFGQGAYLAGLPVTFLCIAARLAPFLSYYSAVRLCEVRDEYFLGH